MSQSATPPGQTAALRAQGIRGRQALSDAERTHAADVAARLASRQAVWRAAETIAAYLPTRGEFDPRPLLLRAHADGKRCFVPIVVGNDMQFVQWSPEVAMAPNRFGIPEPVGGEPRAGRELDLVFAPLVAFDDVGNRLGMGGGYYDRAFAYRLEDLPGPYLVGLAFAAQRVAALDVMPWDVPLDAIVTENGWMGFPANADSHSKEK